MKAFDIHSFFGVAGEAVPVVDAADMKAMWEYGQDINKRHPHEQVGIGAEIWQQVCKPGANIGALSFRLGMLGTLEMMLDAVCPGGKLSDHAFKVAAEMDLKWMPVGVPQKNLGFNVEDFLTQVWAESKRGVS